MSGSMLDIPVNSTDLMENLKLTAWHNVLAPVGTRAKKYPSDPGRQAASDGGVSAAIASLAGGDARQFPTSCNLHEASRHREGRPGSNMTRAALRRPIVVFPNEDDQRQDRRDIIMARADPH